MEKAGLNCLGEPPLAMLSAFATPALNFSCMNELVGNFIFLYLPLQPAISGWNHPPFKLLQVAFLFVLEDVHDQDIPLILLYCW